MSQQDYGFTWRSDHVREDDLTFSTWKVTITDASKFIQAFPRFARSRLQSGVNVALDAVARRAAGRLSPEALQAKMLAVMRGEKAKTPPSLYVYKGVSYATEEELVAAIEADKAAKKQQQAK
jgi:hypothetical protein